MFMNIEVLRITDLSSHIPSLDRSLPSLEHGSAMRAVEVPASGLMELAGIGIAVIDGCSERRK
jgi:hypothetical protein